MKTLICALGLMIFACNGSTSPCPGGSPEVSSSTRTIRLKEKLPDRFFYYRVERHAIIVDASSFTERLAKSVKESGSSNGPLLLESVRSLAKTNKAGDLFSVAFTNSRSLKRIELLLANALQASDAAVIDVYSLPDKPNLFLKTLVLTSFEKRAYKARQLCTPSEDLVLFVTDSIE